ncbi:MAG: hypothetical protein ACE37B_14360 [Ilumatobacter sp.]|uniref:hypothetical protein n=1 Tax=Ilumatobacter sp. TaxID=1967498 RepID=UPI00391BDE1E
MVTVAAKVAAAAAAAAVVAVAAVVVAAGADAPDSATCGPMVVACVEVVGMRLSGCRGAVAASSGL